jgi:putative DNA primase/helicase
MSKITELAHGQWPAILGALAGLTTEQLTDRHQPCPLCGGTDRYRFDDQDGSGSWFCNQCGGPSQSGGAGNGIDLLMRRTGWTFKEAADRIEQHLGITKPARPGQSIDTPPTRGAEVFWRYSPTFIVARFPGKKIRPLHWTGTEWIWKAPPAPRPLLNLEQLRTRTGTVLVVEGEKAADAAARLYPRATVTTWPSGCKAIDKADWSPLTGRRVILWPDADAVGQHAMDQLAQRLLRLPVDRVQMVTPPAGVPEGWDLADAAWTDAEALEHLKAHLSQPLELDADPDPKPLQPELHPEPDDADPEVPELDPGLHFTPLGFDGDAYYYQPHRTGQVMRLSRSAHTSTNLVALAPLEYWTQLAPGARGGVDWTQAASTLFSICADLGVYNPDIIRGRGAWWDSSRPVLHLGDRIIADGKAHPALRPFDSRFLYQRMSPLKGPGAAKPLTDAEALVICEVAERFHWEVPASGLLLAGWVTLAPVCGALQWRPHAWLTASAGSGKSAILDRYVAPLLADMGLIVAGNTTEAGLRQTLRSDALPVVFDEAESNEKADQVRMQNILSLARVASSESHATLLKGSPGGDVTRFNIRSMFLMSSIATALKQGADRSRFAQLTLRSPTDLPKAERIAHWEALDRDLERHITPDTALRLIARTVSLIPVIRQSVRVFSRAAAERFDSQRLGDQYGTLLAGAWSLMSSEVPTDQQARDLIDQNDWEPYSQATEVPDEQRCIHRILQHQVRVETDEKTYTRTLGELVEIAVQHRMDRDISMRQATEVLGRHGLKVVQEQQQLLVSNTAEALATILKDTAWSHSWATVLSRLQGATKAGTVRFNGAGAVSRAVALQIAGL